MSEDRYIVTAEEIAAMEGIAKTHFLNPNARRINKSLGDVTGLLNIGFHIIEVQPRHETSEQHVHHMEEECVYILSGEAVAVIGDKEYAVKAGDFLGYRKGGQAHSIRNSGTGLLRCIVVGQRLPHDVADYPKRAKRLYRNVGMAFDLVDVDTIEHPIAGAKK